MIILHFLLQPQFKYELFHIHFTSQKSVLNKLRDAAELESVQTRFWSSIHLSEKKKTKIRELVRNLQVGANLANKNDKQMY